MVDSWHVTYIQKLSASFTSISNFQIVSSVEIKLASPNSKWRNFLHEFISDLSRVQISIILLFLEISCKKLVN